MTLPVLEINHKHSIFIPTLQSKPANVIFVFQLVMGIVRVMQLSRR